MSASALEMLARYTLPRPATAEDCSSATVRLHETAIPAAVAKLADTLNAALS